MSATIVFDGNIGLRNETVAPNATVTAGRGTLAVRTDSTANAGVFLNTDGLTTWVQLTMGGGTTTFTADVTYTLFDNSATSWVIGATGDTDMMTFDTTNAAEVVVIGATLGLRLNDSSELRFGTPGTDVVYTPDGTNVVVTATGVIIYNDDVVSALGTTANDRFSISYNSGSTRGQIVGTDITAGGATQATRPFRIATGARTKSDANAGVPRSGDITLVTGATDVTAVATGGISGDVSIASGATDVNDAGGTGGASGVLSFTTGNASSTLGTASGNSGTITVQTGTSADGNTGVISIVTGNAGAGGGATSGDIVLTTGTAGGTRGVLDVNVATINTVTQATQWLTIDNSPAAIQFGSTGILSALAYDSTNTAEEWTLNNTGAGVNGINGIRAIDNVAYAVGTTVNDRFRFQYASASTAGQIIGTDISAAAATQATRPLLIATGARTTTDANPGTVSGALTINTGTTTQTGAAAGAASGTITVVTGATSQSTANTGGDSGGATFGSGATDATLAAGTGGLSGTVSLRSGNTDVSTAVAATGGATGAVTVQTGNALSTGATATSGVSGILTLRSGTSADANTGNLAINSGNASAVGAGILSGNIAVSSGTVGGTGTTGTISFTTGNPAGAGVSGPITSTTGTTTGAANTGLISFTTGGTGTGTTGAITLATGNATGAGTSGNITLTPGTTVAGTRGQVVALGLRTAQATAVAIAGATVLTLADSGGIFNIDQDAAFDIDLPSPTTGSGLSFLFLIGDAGANTVTITVLGGAATFIGNIINDVTSVISIAGTETSINLVSGAALGDTVEITSISTALYLVRAITSTAGGITAT